MSVLQKIIEERKKSIPSASSLAALPVSPSRKNFLSAIARKADGRLALVAELKRKSPSKGSLREGLSVPEAVELYRGFASAMSILTEPNYFGGSLEDLRQASQLTDLPLLRKDFLTDPLQVKEARAYGADAYLLIQAALSPSQMAEMLAAGREYNMPALVEVHDEKELEQALAQKIEIIGINNRNLNDLKIDLATTPRLVSLIPPELQKKLVIVAESGLSCRADLEALPAAVDAVLIGTSFMSSANPRQLLQEMFGA